MSPYERDAMRSAMHGVMRDKFRNRFCIVLFVVSPFKRGVMRSVMRVKIITREKEKIIRWRCIFNKEPDFT